MTREELIQAFEMRLDGKSYEEIGKYFNCSKQNVNGALTRVLKRSNSLKKSVYPNLSIHILTNYRTTMTFCEEHGINESTLRNILKGRQQPSFKFTKRICELTGEPIEYIFKEREENDI